MDRDESQGDCLRLELDRDADDVPFATWDPDFPEENATPYSHLAQPIIVVLDPGDMLYLPAMWYHKVSQFCTPDDEGFVLAVNYWFALTPCYPPCPRRGPDLADIIYATGTTWTSVAPFIP